MKLGDRVRFLKESRAWILRRVEPDATGSVVEVYSDAQAKGTYKVDVSFPGLKELKRGIDVAELEIIGPGYVARAKQPGARQPGAPGYYVSRIKRASPILHGPKGRFYLSSGSAMLGLLVVGAFTLHAAKAAQHEKRIVEMVRPICAHNGLTNKEMRRMVRFARSSSPTREDAVHAVVALCRGNG